MHEELNTSKQPNIDSPKPDYDENISYYNFKKYFNEQNNSKIQKYFFGIKENIENYSW